MPGNNNKKKNQRNRRRRSEEEDEAQEVQEEAAAPAVVGANASNAEAAETETTAVTRAEADARLEMLCLALQHLRINKGLRGFTDRRGTFIKIVPTDKDVLDLIFSPNAYDPTNSQETAGPWTSRGGVFMTKNVNHPANDLARTEAIIELVLEEDPNAMDEAIALQMAAEEEEEEEEGYDSSSSSSSASSGDKKPAAKKKKKPAAKKQPAKKKKPAAEEDPKANDESGGDDDGDDGTGRGGGGGGRKKKAGTTTTTTTTTTNTAATTTTTTTNTATVSNWANLPRPPPEGLLPAIEDLLPELEALVGRLTDQGQIYPAGGGNFSFRNSEAARQFVATHIVNPTAAFDPTDGYDADARTFLDRALAPLWTIRGGVTGATNVADEDNVRARIRVVNAWLDAGCPQREEEEKKKKKNTSANLPAASDNSTPGRRYRGRHDQQVSFADDADTRTTNAATTPASRRSGRITRSATAAAASSGTTSASTASTSTTATKSRGAKSPKSTGTSAKKKQAGKKKSTTAAASSSISSGALAASSDRGRGRTRGGASDNPARVRPVSQSRSPDRSNGKKSTIVGAVDEIERLEAKANEEYRKWNDEQHQATNKRLDEVGAGVKKNAEDLKNFQEKQGRINEENYERFDRLEAKADNQESRLDNQKEQLNDLCEKTDESFARSNQALGASSEAKEVANDAKEEANDATEEARAITKRQTTADAVTNRKVQRLELLVEQKLQPQPQPQGGANANGATGGTGAGNANGDGVATATGGGGTQNAGNANAGSGRGWFLTAFWTIVSTGLSIVMFGPDDPLILLGAALGFIFGGGHHEYLWSVIQSAIAKFLLAIAFVVCVIFLCCCPVYFLWEDAGPEQRFGLVIFCIAGFLFLLEYFYEGVSYWFKGGSDDDEKDDGNKRKAE